MDPTTEHASVEEKELGNALQALHDNKFLAKAEKRLTAPLAEHFSGK